MAVRGDLSAGIFEQSTESIPGLIKSLKSRAHINDCVLGCSDFYFFSHFEV